MSLFQFVLQLVAMLILSGAMVFFALLGVFWLIDWIAARDDGVRWRWMGERHDEPGYTGEVSHDGGKTWVDENTEQAVWPSEAGAVE